MELPNQEAEMPIPLNSTYGGVHGHVHGHHPHSHMIHHHDHHPPPPPPSSVNNHIIPSSNNPPNVGPTPLDDDDDDDDDDHHAVITAPFNNTNNNNNNNNKMVVVVKYKECLKNHAASMGGNATDGCGEFMPSGEEGSLEALTCSACNCHRNFHRKEIEGDNNNNNNNTTNINTSNTCYNNSRIGRKVFVGLHHPHPHRGGYLGGPVDHHHAIGYHHIPSSRPHHQMLMSYNNMGGGGGGGSLPSDQSDEMEGGGGGGGGGGFRPPQMVVKKRFRTKFTQEQKEKMLGFAERVGWKIQKQEEGVVQQFCQEVGVKRRVLKVWMHNNKHNLAKKNALNQASNVSDNQV